MRNSKFEMRNCRATVATRFRISHFAFRIWLLTLLLLPSTTSSQVDPSGSWRTLHTEHFRIHFRPALRARATAAAAEAERAYRLLSTELHPPRGVIDLTLSDDIDTPNGFTTTYPSNRFTILLTPPVTDPGLATYYESRFTAGGRAEGSYHRQAVGADAAAQKPRSPWDALLFTRWPDGL